MERVDCLVVGAGAIGLAVARALAKRGREVVVLEASALIGSETSSRNSGVIHAGIYYPTGSLKAELCVAGKHALYAFCRDYGVAHDKVGKVLVATEDPQLEALDDYRRRAAANGVDDLEPLSAADVRELEPAVRCVAGLLSPSTGIIEPHDYLLALLGDAERHGASVAFNSPFTGAAIEDGGISVAVGGAEPATLLCNGLVNAAGLHAPRIASRIAGLAAEHVPRAYFAKGNYFHLIGRSPFKRLVYPLPSRGSLGVHVSFDLAGRCRFGPDIHWVEAIDYRVDTAQAAAFYRAIRRYWPGLPDGALAPDYTGVRPKLTPEGAAAADFVIQTHAEHGIEGLVNLFGIESPGLTSSLAIAERVAASV